MTCPRPYEIISYSQLEKPLEREKNMTRKDYQLIADTIKRTSEVKVLGKSNATLRVLACNLAAQLQKDNPNFKPALFLKACGV